VGLRVMDDRSIQGHPEYGAGSRMERTMPALLGRK
jgi:hypothetical protein